MTINKQIEISSKLLIKKADALRGYINQPKEAFAKKYSKPKKSTEVHLAVQEMTQKLTEEFNELLKLPLKQRKKILDQTHINQAINLFFQNTPNCVDEVIILNFLLQHDFLNDLPLVNLDTNENFTVLDVLSKTQNLYQGSNGNQGLGELLSVVGTQWIKKIINYQLFNPNNIVANIFSFQQMNVKGFDSTIYPVWQTYDTPETKKFKTELSLILFKKLDTLNTNINNELVTQLLFNQTKETLQVLEQDYFNFGLKFLKIKFSSSKDFLVVTNLVKVGLLNSFLNAKKEYPLLNSPLHILWNHPHLKLLHTQTPSPSINNNLEPREINILFLNLIASVIEQNLYQEQDLPPIENFLKNKFIPLFGDFTGLLSLIEKKYLVKHLDQNQSTTKKNQIVKIL